MARWSTAVWRPIPSTSDPKIRPIGVVLHVDAGNAYSLYNWFNGPSGGIESHFHIAKDGHVEQYRDTEQEADANYKGNSFILDRHIDDMGLSPGRRVGFISVETQGYATGKWTPQQMERIYELLTWMHETHDVPLEPAAAWNRPGVGYHVMWGAPGAWTPAVGKVCPGPDRIAQFRNEIVPWMEDHDMIDRSTDLGPDETLAGEFEKAQDDGWFSPHTQPGHIVTADKLAAFINRHTRKVTKQMIAAAAGGAGATNADRIIEQIGQILSGGG